MDIRFQDEFLTAQMFGEIEAPFWLGASDIQSEGNWLWDPNQEEVSLSEYWEDRRPSNSNRYNCLGMLHFTVSGTLVSGMFDAACTMLYRSVCEY